MARTRNFLIDNTLGKIFTNTTSVSAATAANLIAGTKLLVRTVTAGTRTTAVRVTNNLGLTGVYFPTDSLITTAVISFATAPTNGSTSIRFKSGTTYATATTINTTSINASTLSTTATLNATIPAGQYLFIDIASAAAVGSGFGLSIIANYYGN